MYSRLENKRFSQQSSKVPNIEWKDNPVYRALILLLNISQEQLFSKKRGQNIRDYKEINKKIVYL